MDDDRDDKWITKIELQAMNIQNKYTDQYYCGPQGQVKERRDMIEITEYKFKLDDNDINILATDAKKLYNDLDKDNVFGVDLRPISVKSDGTFNVFCDVKLESGQQFRIHILQLKELYYVLHDIFKKTNITR